MKKHNYKQYGKYLKYKDIKEKRRTNRHRLLGNEIFEADDFVFETSRLDIRTCPSRLSHCWYFKIYETANPWGYQFNPYNYCRISMTEAKYMGEPDEHLILNSKDIQELVEMLKKEYTARGHIEHSGITNWEQMIYAHNFESGFIDRSTPVELVGYIDPDLPMPDYTKLIPGE